jgi:hypothetical protein
VVVRLPGAAVELNGDVLKPPAESAVAVVCRDLERSSVASVELLVPGEVAVLVRELAGAHRIVGVVRAVDHEKGGQREADRRLLW